MSHAHIMTVKDWYAGLVVTLDSIATKHLQHFHGTKFSFLKCTIPRTIPQPPHRFPEAPKQLHSIHILSCPSP